MMKSRKTIMLAALWLLVATVATAQSRRQEIQISQFEQNQLDLGARMNPVLDRNGDACARIKFHVRDTSFVVTSNMGVLKRETELGVISVWVPQGTKRLTIRHEGVLPLVYNIPMAIVTKTGYKAVLEVVDEAAAGNVQKPRRPYKAYIGAGYNVTAISGPSVAVGMTVNHHQIELGAVYGLNKSDELYFYNSEGSLVAGHQYNAIRAQLRYGYEIALNDMVSLTPQVAVVYNAIVGSAADGVSGSTLYKNANSLTVGGAVSLSVSLTKSFGLYITPEYDVAAYKDNTCKIIGEADNSVKNWSEGFNLNVGLRIMF
jgi:hypothetical protein